MTVKDQQREQSHETILTSAARLIRERGIAGTRVSDVMNGAGLTVGGFYAHFASKEALVNDTLRRAATAMRERLFRNLEGKPEGARAEVVLKRYLSVAHRDEYVEGCSLPAIVGEVGTTANEHAEVLAEQVAALASDLQRIVPKGEGTLPARQVAVGLVALMFGGLALSRAVRGTALSEEILRACRAVGLVVLQATTR